MNEREIFLEALELATPDARAAYLQGACGRDAGLRRQVDELLKEHFANDSLLAAPALDCSPTVATTPPAEASAQMIGRYKLLEQIGEGGFGEVWMAEQREPVKRRVALKLIKLGMDSRQIVARFEAERQALALMDHPNIAKIFDAGTTETGRPYFVMELVRGMKITEYCDQNQLPTKERLDLFIKVCQAIQHAHQKGIIHRDIKPSNILVTLHDGVPVPKVIDFGIAKATQQELTDKTVFTQFQQFIGTPAYISPEQAEMSGLDIDTRADIYSLGVLLYELLVGQTPFSAKEMMEGGLDALRKIIREKEPQRPSNKLNTLAGDARTTAAKRRQTAVETLVHQLQGDLDWIVMKCLEKDRVRRYDTATGLAADVQRYLANEPVVARPPSASYRFQKMARRNRVAFAATAAIAMVLVFGVLVSTWQAVRATRAQSKAVLAQQNEAKQRQIADDARANEAQLRVRAEAQELAARRRAYASDVNLVQQALAVNNLGRAQDLLNRQRPQSGEQDLRGWEWRYLWQQCRSDALFTLGQETNVIVSLAASADGKWIAVGKVGGLSIWDLQTRRAIDRLPAGESSVRAAFSPRDRLLAFSVASRRSPTNWQYSIRLWNSETRELVAELSLQSACMSLAFSGDGQTLVTSTMGKQGQIALWRMPDGKELASYPAPERKDTDNSFAVAPDMSVAAQRRQHREVRLIDLASGQERWSAKATEEGVLAVAFSADGKILASGAGYTESTIRLWDVASGQEINRLHGHRSFVGALMFWPDGRTLASGSGDQTIRLWDLHNPTNVPAPRVLRGHKDEITQLALLPDQTTLVSGCKDGSVCLWDTASSRRQSARIILPGRFSTWRVDPDGKSVVTLAGSGSVARWKGASFQEMEPLLDVGTNFITSLISADARLLATGSEQGSVRVWDLRRGALLREWANGISPQPFAFLKDGKRLVTVDRGDGVHREWDLANWQETQSWRGAAELHFSCSPTVSPDERWCLTLNYGGAGVIRDMTTRNERKLNLSLNEVSGVTISPDGKRLAIGSDGMEAIKLWDVESRQELLTLEGEGSAFYGTAFSPDGNILGFRNGSGLLHLWRAPSWDEIAAAEARDKANGGRP